MAATETVIHGHKIYFCEKNGTENFMGKCNKPGQRQPISDAIVICQMSIAQSKSPRETLKLIGLVVYTR